jgi:hypothetical protein
MLTLTLTVRLGQQRWWLGATVCRVEACCPWLAAFSERRGLVQASLRLGATVQTRKRGLQAARWGVQLPRCVPDWARPNRWRFHARLGCFQRAAAPF